MDEPSIAPGPSQINFTVNEQYAHTTLTYIVDNVCLYHSKLDYLQSQLSATDDPEGQAAI
jgi:hypothetical protein